jgi:hypothetical protein
MIRRYSLLLFIVSISCTVYALRVDNVVGMFRDDAWYALLGKAIASGNGYSLINAPNPGITPIYPPFFPFLLSLVFRAIPAFPETSIDYGNVWSWYSCLHLFQAGRMFP